MGIYALGSVRPLNTAEVAIVKQIHHLPLTLVVLFVKSMYDALLSNPQALALVVQIEKSCRRSSSIKTPTKQALIVPFISKRSAAHVATFILLAYPKALVHGIKLSNGWMAVCLVRYWKFFSSAQPAVPSGITRRA